MKHKFNFLLLLILPLLLFSSISLSEAIDQETFQQASNFSNLTLEITSPNKTFVLLEPVPITVSISNKTSQPITGHTLLKFSSNLVKLFVMRDDGKAQEIQQLSPFPKEIFVNAVEIKPGEHFQVNELLTLDLDKIFSKPGAYKVYAVLFDPNSKQKVKSSNLSLHILEPEGLNRQAFEYIQANSKRSDFFSGRYLSDNQKAQSVLEEFVSAYSESAYGDYATFLLGELYFVQENFEKANQQLYKLANKKDFPLADKAARYIEKAKEKLE